MKPFRIVLALLSAALLILSWPEIGGFSFVIFIAFVPLLLVWHDMSTAGEKGIFKYAAITFGLWTLFTCYWIYFASFFGVVVAVLLHALGMGLVFKLAEITRSKAGVSKGYIAWVTYWISWEFLHHHWDLSFPWLTIGNVFANQPEMIQWYEYTGVFGGSLWVLCVNVIAAAVIIRLRSLPVKKTAVVSGIISIALPTLIPIAISYQMYTHYEEKSFPVNAVVLQPNIDPYNEKFSGLSPEQQVRRMVNLAEANMDSATDLLVGPETALPRALWEDEVGESPEVRDLSLLNSRFPKADIIIGLSSVKAYADAFSAPPTARLNKNQNFWYDYFNTALHISPSGSMGFYHKSKLVAGVEKMPFPWLLSPLESFALDLGGIVGSLGVQQERTVFPLSCGASAAPVICYESVFGEYVGEYILNGAGLITIITNDGWWDDTPGYKQHMAYARLRAIEMRRSIVRSANTGISCFINQRGDVSQPTEWWKEAVLKGTVNANTELTFYARAGDYIARLSAFIACLLLLHTFVITRIPERNKT